MSDSSQKDLGVIQVLIARLETERLPRLLKLKKKVEGGEKLDASEMQFLTQMGEDAGNAIKLAAKHPAYQSLVDRLSSVYQEVTRKALENEQKKS
jgi:predicted RNase H-like nuclease